MFTGIIEETGSVESLVERENSWRMTLAADRVMDDLQMGDSLAVNGCCVTVAALSQSSQTVEVDLLDETLNRTAFRILKPDSRVNLERSLLPTTRMGGHFISGHIDDTGTITILEPRGKDVFLEIRYAERFSRYVVEKGCIAIDGISLTVTEVGVDTLAVWLIPHTLEVTHLRDRRVGDPVNLEFDLLAKYVERQLKPDPA